MILSTKLYPPPPSGSLVHRARLIQRLMSGLTRPFTLVSAPAGFGKSTLLAEWAAEAQRARGFQLGWLSLDAQENAPAQFWSYFTAAWQTALPANVRVDATLLDQLAALLKTDDKSIAERVPGLILSLMLSVESGSGAIPPVLLVLDDYHQIRTPEIHAALAQLIERLPAHVRLAIAARSDPPLPIPRLRVREQITEIRAADLRFTNNEIAALFEQIAGAGYDAQDLAAIEASTEGWAAGLKMALLALQAQERSPEETRQFWASFTGRNVYILDYLTEEVLSHLPEPTQDFLIKTSLLDRLTDGLCAAVAGIPQPAARAILDQLERANLFLIPLDQERRWFRYHHLFADLLRVRLQQYSEQNDLLIQRLHQRAAEWYEAAGWIDEAMQHSITAQDWERAARLVEEHANEYLDRGQLAAVLRWVEALPSNLLRRRLNLCIQMIWALAHAGRTHLIGPLIKEADAALADYEAQRLGQQVEPPVQISEFEAVRARASLAVVRAYGAILAAKPEPALRLAEAALAALPAARASEPIDNLARERAWLNWVIGYAQRGLGNIEQAILFFGKAVEIGRQSGAVWEDHSTDLGIAYRLSGRLEEAARVFEDSLRAGAESGLRNKGNLSRVEAYLSAVRMEQNRVAEALAHARTGVEYLQWWPSYNHIATAYGFYGLALLSTGVYSEAEQAIERADQEHRKGEVTPFVTRLVESARVRLWLAREERAALSAWVDAHNSGAEELAAASAARLNEYEEMHRITLARACIGLARLQKTPAEGASNLLHQSIRLLDVLAASALASKRAHAAIEIHLLGALARWELVKSGQGTSLDALDWLARSLRAGLPGGYRRSYLEAGQPAAELLRALLERDRQWIAAVGVDAEAARALLAEFPAQAYSANPAEVAQPLAEPLTEREKDVLHLLAAGLSNREMAERLVLSEGTIKTHVHNLIGKLGAQSRTQVIAKARELGIL